MLYGLAILPIATVLVLTGQGAQPPAKVVPSALSAHLAALSADFVCPEALPNDAERQSALPNFSHAYAQAEPAATDSEVRVYWRVLLKTHNCKQTLPRVGLSTQFRFDVR